MHKSESARGFKNSDKQSPEQLISDLINSEFSAPHPSFSNYRLIVWKMKRNTFNLLRQTFLSFLLLWNVIRLPRVMSSLAKNSSCILSYVLYKVFTSYSIKSFTSYVLYCIKGFTSYVLYCIKGMWSSVQKKTEFLDKFSKTIDI